MKLLFYFLFSVLIAEAQDIKPSGLQGLFVYQGQFEILFEKQIVELKGDDVKQGKIDELTESGFTCSAKKPKYVVCDRILPGKLNPILENAIEEKFKGFFIKIYPQVGKANLIFNSDFHKVWEIEQKILVGDISYNPIFQTWTRGVFKFYVGEEYFEIISDKRLSLSQYIDFQGPQVLQRFFVNTSLERAD